MKFLSDGAIPDYIIRKFRYLRISVTKRCNLKCQYCNPDGKTGTYTNNDKSISPAGIKSIVSLFTKLGNKKVRITGGEPLLRGDIADIISEIRRISKIKEIGLTTNGVLLKDLVKELKSAGLNRVNISLPSLSPKRYREITGGETEPVLAGIEASIKEGIYTKINTVAFGHELIQEIPLYIELLKKFDVQLRFIEYMPLCKGRYRRDKFIDLKRIEEILIDEYNFSVSEYNRDILSKIYRRKDLKGEIGFIKPVTHQFCDICNKIRISPEGELIPCLFSTERLNVLKLMTDNREENLPGEILRFTLRNHKKPDIKSFIDNDIVPSEIFEVGG